MRTVRLVGIDPKARMEISFALPSIVIRVWNASFGRSNGDQGRGHVDESLSVCDPSVGIACDRGRKSRASHSVQSALRAIAEMPWSVGSLKNVVRDSQ
jgi:hypothetical protein